MHHVHIAILVDENSVVPKVSVEALPTPEARGSWPPKANVAEITMLEAVLTRARRFAQELGTESYEGEST